ncbi:hypothetical protein A3D05_06660 [Candidatus Gottesmanbacteria bacterium RIFCSPHIGHO2_02_FULL_40_24]|uniref:Uncharacterized protein n=1 Tax=Candidatus Gottesmanbacteria bacterium RIFCSPHIGHO2_01_FULL_40_15 TaxID=1798376 RepID=A0A1F5Z3J2_9BACT|nr:MAG: hypothetical protein A2777_03710 [Candidatus Gottesmanbacteria bacterium RIFCSPHIGHO2_01_FULL_40_15]OGG17193.1 MAG: hypothetical protein A3D05_06660 [Candidatus Gottesmanbacteria bacterium RIFCSPHIGHO2_02_FULL_40_24]OGG22370.1 MAG: hypothetical protein A3B48_02590 [Candidatus Gottesmanbacteria bacterium RIFCSPLOWO2_01_FULL_40_10]OGG23587.1 MAG: hypothetical protein A3E42_05395 [Candidatus Gottesmanbacteria bacterium RIFCSPHIGHO2_12_FULL_40_13]OGG32225.1 MAG: hypothetical protein A3I80_0
MKEKQTEKNKQILKLIKKYEFLVSSVTVIVFVLFLTVKLLIPNITKAREIYRDGNRLRERLTRLQRKERTLSSIDGKLFQDNFVKLNYVIPASRDYVLLFTTLDQLQQKLGISISRTDFQLGAISSVSALTKKDPGTNSYLVPLSLEVIGTPDQLQNFLLSLSDLSGRLITTGQIRLEILDFGLIRAVIDGNTYFNPLPESIGKIDSQLPEYNQTYKELFDRILEKQFPIEAIEEIQKEVPVGKENLFL